MHTNFLWNIPINICTSLHYLIVGNKKDNIENRATEIVHIPFNQGMDLIIGLNPVKHRTLWKINTQFGGLCELVCNCLLMSNLLNKGKSLDFLKQNVKILQLDEEKVKSSHILNVYSVFQKLMAYIFGIYPDNIFSISEQWNLITKKSWTEKVVNRQLLEEGFKKISEDEILKLEVFSRGVLGFQGHALLIKKHANNKFTFFDPNTGEHRNLSFSDLSDKIDEQVKQMKGTDIFILRSQDFLNRLKI
ncbi:MAG: hypothetical protein H0U49_12225 [Parachlamydiaceae bacterium]|nr:hypothetical protein [Parachlamydiaceae bacterium]